MSLTLLHINIYPLLKLNVIKLAPYAYIFEVFVLAPILSGSQREQSPNMPKIFEGIILFKSKFPFHYNGSITLPTKVCNL